MSIDENINSVLTKLVPRSVRPTWDEFGMGHALFAALRSPDPNTQVGACILDFENRIIGSGYNGLPPGCSNNVFPWEREGPLHKTKYAYVVHAERNAIHYCKTNDLTGCRLYVTLFPCHICAQDIVSAKIEEIIYFSDKYHDTDSAAAARFLFDNCRGSRGIPYRQLATPGLVRYAEFLKELFIQPPKP